LLLQSNYNIFKLPNSQEEILDEDISGEIATNVKALSNTGI
jgi:hypothetical protein